MSGVGVTVRRWFQDPAGSPELRPFLAFRRFFALKMGMALVGEYWSGPKAAAAAIGAAALLAATTGVAARPALAVLCGFALGRVERTLPFTINHFYLEPLLLAVLALAGRPDAQVATGAVKLMTGAIWFYAGVQKVVHGAFLTGETFTLYALFGDAGRLAPSLRWLAGLGGALPALGPPSASWMARPVALTPATVLTLRAAAGAVIGGELVLPALLVPRRTRALAAAGLLGLQAMLIAVTAEVDIAITSAAGLLLFFPREAPRVYPYLLGATLLAYVGVIG
jgi:hypothetical protein